LGQPSYLSRWEFLLLALPLSNDTQTQTDTGKRWQAEGVGGGTHTQTGSQVGQKTGEARERDTRPHTGRVEEVRGQDNALTNYDDDAFDCTEYVAHSALHGVTSKKVAERK